MSEKNGFDIHLHQPLQRLTHFALIGAVFSGQKSKSVRLKIDERIAKHHQMGIHMSNESNLAWSSAVDGYYFEKIVESLAISHRRERGRIIRFGVGMGEDRNRKLLGEDAGCTPMVLIGDDDAAYWGSVVL